MLSQQSKRSNREQVITQTKVKAEKTTWSVVEEMERRQREAVMHQGGK